MRLDPAAWARLLDDPPRAVVAARMVARDPRHRRARDRAARRVAGPRRLAHGRAADDTPLLTSPDGYWFAAGAGQHLTGAWGANPRLPLATDHALVALAWLVARVGPWSLDQVIVYLPALLGALVAAPMVWLGRLLGAARLGVVAALALVTAPVLFARTAAGYFDTAHAFAVGVPLMVVLHLVALVEHDCRRHAGWAGLWLAAYPWFYNQGASLGLALAVSGAIAVAWRWRVTRAPLWRDALVMLALSQLPLHPLVRVPIVALAYGGLTYGGRWIASMPRALKLGLAVGGMVAAAPVAWRVVPVVLAKLAYFAGAEAPVGGPVAYGEVGAFVSETQTQTLGALVESMGPTVIIVVAAVGAVLAMARYRSTMLLLPLAALGAFAAIGGPRFAIYASPVLALGLGYVLVWVADRVRSRAASVIALVVLTAGALGPSVARDGRCSRGRPSSRPRLRRWTRSGASRGGRRARRNLGRRGRRRR